MNVKSVGYKKLFEELRISLAPGKVNDFWRIFLRMVKFKKIFTLDVFY